MKILNKNHLVYMGLVLAISTIGVEAFADTVNASAGDAALMPVYNKILGALSGTLGKIIMGVGILLAGVAALAGMNKAMIFTPLGTGIFLGNAKALIEWVFGN